MNGTTKKQKQKGHPQTHGRTGASLCPVYSEIRKLGFEIVSKVRPVTGKVPRRVPLSPANQTVCPQILSHAVPARLKTASSQMSLSPQLGPAMPPFEREPEWGLENSLPRRSEFPSPHFRQPVSRTWGPHFHSLSLSVLRCQMGLTVPGSPSGDVKLKGRDYRIFKFYTFKGIIG